MTKRKYYSSGRIANRQNKTGQSVVQCMCKQTKQYINKAFDFNYSIILMTVTNNS